MSAMTAKFYVTFSIVVFFSTQVFISNALDVTIAQFEDTWKCADICKKESGSYKYHIEDVCVLLMGYNYVTANAMHAEARIRELSLCGDHNVKLKDGTKKYTVLLCTLSGQVTGKICVTKGKRTKDIFVYNYDQDSDTCTPFDEKTGVA